MATIRRAGFGTVFELEDSKVGIGTDAATHTLQALGNIRSEGVQDVGISSLTTYQGFTDKEAGFTGQIDIESQSGATSDEIVIDGDVTVSSATTFTSGPQNLTVTDTFTLPSGDTNSREIKPTIGSLRFNQDFATLEFYTGNNWATVNAITEMQNSPGNQDRGIFCGGYAPTTPSISFVNVSSKGNAFDFGHLEVPIQYGGGCSTGTRGVFGGGRGPAPSYTKYNVIQYLTISQGDGIGYAYSAATSVRGTVMGGMQFPSPYPSRSTVDAFNFDSKGEVTVIGDLSEGRRDGACNSDSHGGLGGF